MTDGPRYSDCTNCGEPWGYSFGICEKCTPPEYFDLEEDLNEAILVGEANAVIKNTLIEKQILELQMLADHNHIACANEATKDITEQMELLCEKHRKNPW